MLTASFVLTALGITIVLGAALTAYLWLVRRPQLEVIAGITTLAAMRWREFSRFVIEALHAQGFEASRIEPPAERGQQADLLLNRGERTWVLSCKQGANSRITAPQVSELAKAVREAGASGGILATLGRIDARARARSHDIELLDGVTLWPLIDPLLPPSLHLDLAARARAITVRNTTLAWLASMVVGIALAMLLTPPVGDSVQGADTDAITVTAVTPTKPVATQRAAAPASAPLEAAPLEAAPISEDEQRDQVAGAISLLPGIDRAIWATRSTLLVYLQDDDADDADIARLCATLKRYDALRASRVQLQPPAGSTSPVRFMQCQMF